MQARRDDDERLPILCFKQGDNVRVVQGVDTGRIGTIIQVYPTREWPYVVKLGEGWYIHFSEDRLAQAH